jgi:hypothetical protein
MQRHAILEDLEVKHRYLKRYRIARNVMIGRVSKNNSAIENGRMLVIFASTMRKKELT